MNIDYIVPFISGGVVLLLWGIFLYDKVLPWRFKLPVGIVLSLWLFVTTLPFMYWIK